MLDVYWACVCVLFAIFGAFLFTRYRGDDQREVSYFGMIFIGVTMAYVFLWERLENTYFVWLINLIPNEQVSLHGFTIWMLALFTWVVSLLILAALPSVLIKVVNNQYTARNLKEC
jgi:hypothetical protein